MKKSYSIELAGRTLTIETGELAGLANSSILVRYGDTVVLCTATASSKPREGLDYFPLSVDYEEKLYAVGKIPGSFQRREGRPSEKPFWLLVASTVPCVPCSLRTCAMTLP